MKKSIGSIKQLISWDRVKDAVGNFGYINHLKGILSSDEKMSILIKRFEGSVEAFLTSIEQKNISETTITKLQALLPGLTINTDSDASISDQINSYYKSMLDILSQALYDGDFKTYLTKQIFASLICFETKSYKLQDSRIINKAEKFVRDSYGTTIDKSLHQSLDKNNIAGIDIPFELLNLSDNDCAAYLYGLYFNLVEGCTGYHPTIDTDTKPLYMWGSSKDQDIGDFQLTPRGIQLFETLYNLARLHITGDHNRPTYVFKDQYHIYQLLRGERYIQQGEYNDKYDAANVVSVARSLFHFIGHHRQYFNLDDIISSNRIKGVNACVDSSKLQQQQLSQRRSQDVVKIDIGGLGGLGGHHITRDDFAHQYYDVNRAMGFCPSCKINDIEFNWSFRIKLTSSYLTKFVNDPKYNHIDELYDKIGNRFEITPSDNHDNDRKKQLQLLYHLYVHLGSKTISSFKIKGSGFIEYAKNLLKENEGDEQFNHWLKDLINSSQTSSNSKTADGFEDCRLTTKQGVEYQISRGWMENKGSSNHSFYSINKMLDADSRLTGYIDLDWYVHHNKALLDEQIDGEVQLRLLRSDRKYNYERARQSQWILLALQIAREELSGKNYQNHIITKIMEEHFNGDIETSTSPLGYGYFDQIYDAIESNPMSENELQPIYAYLCEYLVNRQFAQVDGGVGIFNNDQGGDFGKQKQYRVKQSNLSRLWKTILTSYEHYKSTVNTGH